MNFLHYDFNIGPNNTVEVTLDKQANVRLLDDINFSKYKRGERHTYHGGSAKTSPVRLSPPYYGHWNLVIDLGGYSGRVNASVRLI
jgi:Domain of unknown function (DUF1883)